MRDMATMREAPKLGIPEVKPAIEMVRGRWEPKMSPRRRHAILQARFCAILIEWAGERGEVGSEWRCYILPPKEKPSSLVPDVAYFSFERMPTELGELREKPTIAPDIAVEVLSPDDRRRLLDEKVGIYLANGCRLVAVVDPQTRSVEMHEPNGLRRFYEPAVAACAAYPDLQIELTEIFARL
jgi:Uma2 family endonuclease